MTFHYLTALVAFAVGASACEINPAEGDEPLLLKLRVLAISSDPPDLALGEQAQLRALVSEPDGNPVNYEWSWCPRRGDGDDNYACLTDETALQSAWAELDSGRELPPYDLGTSETATFDMVFDGELAVPLCQALTRGDADPQSALFICLNDLELSFRLRVTSGDSEVIAFRTVELAGDERNTNPNPGTSIRLVREGDGRTHQLGQPFVEGAYDLTAEFGLDQSEVFTPRDEADEAPRQETLFLSWYVTVGILESDALDGGFGDVETNDGIQTSYLDGGDFDSLNKVLWIANAVGENATLYLILRDERGGLSFTQYDLGTVVADNER